MPSSTALAVQPASSTTSSFHSSPRPPSALLSLRATRYSSSPFVPLMVTLSSPHANFATSKNLLSFHLRLKTRLAGLAFGSLLAGALAGFYHGTLNVALLGIENTARKQLTLHQLPRHILVDAPVLSAQHTIQMSSTFFHFSSLNLFALSSSTFGPALSQSFAAPYPSHVRVV